MRPHIILLFIGLHSYIFVFASKDVYILISTRKLKLCRIQIIGRMPRRPKQQQERAPPPMTLRMNRATPARLVKLYKDTSPDPRRIIEDMGFGGLLKIACHTLLAEFSSWLMAHCFDAESSQLVLPGRGRITLTAESVHDIFELPFGGDEMKYELDVEAINFIHVKYGLDEGFAPRIETILTRLKNNKEANEDFHRSWLMIAVSTFLCPSSGLCISPRCYQPLVDLSRVDKLNWCQFVVEQLKDAARRLIIKILLGGAFFY